MKVDDEEKHGAREKKKLNGFKNGMNINLFRKFTYEHHTNNFSFSQYVRILYHHITKKWVQIHISYSYVLPYCIQYECRQTRRVDIHACMHTCHGTIR